MSEDDMESVTSEYIEEFSAASVSEEITEPAQRFTCFPKLPAELRLRIWKYALPGPRLVRIYLKLEPRQPRQEGEKKKPQVSRLTTSQPPPVGLRVCRESRIEALKEYELAFPTKTSPAQTYINFTTDTIIMDRLASYFPHTYRQTLDNSRSKYKKKVILHREFSKIRFIVVDELFIWSQRLLTSNNFPCLATINVISYGGFNSSLKKGYYELQDAERPDPHNVSNLISAGWVDSWLDGMEYLAKKADANHPPPNIKFVRLIQGKAKDETNGKGPEVKPAAKEYGVQDVGQLVQRRLTINGMLEELNAPEDQGEE